MDDSAVKARIKARREALDITQEDMAERLGIVRNTYANIEKPFGKKGATRLSCQYLPDIANELQISEEELILGFIPCHPGDTDSLEDAKAGYLAKEKSIRDEYERTLKDRDRLIAAYEANIRSLNKLIDEKDQQIAMLKKKRKA